VPRVGIEDAGTVFDIFKRHRSDAKVPKVHSKSKRPRNAIEIKRKKQKFLAKAKVC